MQASPLVIIQVGTPPEAIRVAHGDLPEWFRHALQLSAQSIEVVRVFEGEALPPPDAGRIAIITGSWAMVTEHLPWSEATAEWIRQAMAISMPLFGVCYGHQLMAQALGGKVDYHPQGCEAGCREIALLPASAHDPLLGMLPPRFVAHLSHLQTITELPAGARVLAYSDHDRHQIVRYGPQAVSVQFHPEFTPAISSALIERRADVIRDDGQDPDAMLSNLRDTPEARSILSDFIRLAQRRLTVAPTEPQIV